MRNIITVLREEKGLSVEEAALAVKLDLNIYKTFENNNAKVSKSMQAEIINYLIR